MNIKFASISDFKDITNFFEQHLNQENKAIYSCEFFCPFGIKGAISRKQVIIAKDTKNNIIAALRFYKRKKENISSLYQFAIDETHRSKNLLKQMLKQIDSDYIIVQCPKDIEFNDYYTKTGWIIEKENEEFNFWKLENIS